MRRRNVVSGCLSKGMHACVVANVLKKSPEIRLASAPVLRAIQSTGDGEFCHAEATRGGHLQRAEMMSLISL